MIWYIVSGLFLVGSVMYGYSLFNRLNNVNTFEDLKNLFIESFIILVIFFILSIYAAENVL